MLLAANLGELQFTVFGKENSTTSPPIREIRELHFLLLWHNTRLRTASATLCRACLFKGCMRQCMRLVGMRPGTAELLRHVSLFLSLACGPCHSFHQLGSNASLDVRRRHVPPSESCFTRSGSEALFNFDELHVAKVEVRQRGIIQPGTMDLCEESIAHVLQTVEAPRSIGQAPSRSSSHRRPCAKRGLQHRLYLKAC